MSILIFPSYHETEWKDFPVYLNDVQVIIQENSMSGYSQECPFQTGLHTVKGTSLVCYVDVLSLVGNRHMSSRTYFDILHIHICDDNNEY